jgi:transmembrane sensor
MRETEAIKTLDREQMFAEARAYAAGQRLQALRTFALAASVALVLLLGAIFYLREGSEPQWVAYSTVGRPAEVVTLADGSKIEIGVDTVLRVRIGEQKRDVEFNTGNALFDVMHLENGPPFRVNMRDATIEVVGTRFCVKTTVDRSYVAVLAGAVKVQSVQAEASARILGPGKTLTMLSGGRIIDEDETQAASTTKQPTQTAPNADLFGKTLAEIASAFNQHNGKPQFVIEGAAQSQTLWATLSVDNPEQLIQILQRRPMLVVTREGDRVVVRVKR